ncbi:MAG: DUF2461 domain-containing protein [Bacteroidales bacterium]|nr:DUF2461 domain-containing protein [Bacteroidales bacterium]
MKKVLEFLNNLQENNYREWFEEHKTEYKEAQAIFNQTVDKLIAGISEFDPAVAKLSAKNCTFRIYRDVRFSKNKAPYKTHMGAFISPYGKGGGYSGYYFHIEAEGANYIGGNILSTGVYRPEPAALKSIREEIFLNGDQFQETISKANNFKIETGETLKRVPGGYPSEFKYADYLKLKNYFLTRYVDDNWITSPDLIERSVEEYKTTKDFHDLLNKAISYAFE